MLGTGVSATAGLGQIVNAGFGIANTMRQVYEHSLTPNSAKGNTNAGDINTASNCNTFYFYQMGIKEEYARMIDNYFTMYGYKVNTLKVPNINGRKHWNYIKTIGSIITGQAPNDAIIKLKEIFDNGITLWHNTDTFLDYSQENTIV